MLMCPICGCNRSINTCSCAYLPCTTTTTIGPTPFVCEDGALADVAIDSDCVVYSSPSLPCLGILEGSSLSQLITELIGQAGNCTPLAPGETTTTTRPPTTTTTSTLSPCIVYKVTNTNPIGTSVIRYTPCNTTYNKPVTVGETPIYVCHNTNYSIITVSGSVLLENRGVCNDPAPTTTTSTTTAAPERICFKLRNTFRNTLIDVDFINISGAPDSLSLAAGEIKHKCAISITPTLGLLIESLGDCLSGCSTPTTTTTSTSTSTTTSSTTSTSTSTTTTTLCSEPECSRVMLSGTVKAYTYDFCTNQIQEANIPNFSSYSNYGIAVNTKYLWSIREGRFSRWELSYLPFSATYDTDILYPSGFNPINPLFANGIVAKTDAGNKLIGWNNEDLEFVEIDASGTTAVVTSMFDFGVPTSSTKQRTPIGNPLYTTTGKFITLSRNAEGSYYLTQFDYDGATGTIENDVDITLSNKVPIALLEPTCNCQCSIYVLYYAYVRSNEWVPSWNRLLYSLNLITGALTLVQNQFVPSNVFVNCGGAQLPACMSCDMEIFPTTTTTTAAPTTTTTSTTSTSTSTTSTTTEAPVYRYFADVYDCSLPSPLNCISNNQTVVMGESGGPLSIGAFYSVGGGGPELGQIYEIKGETSTPAWITVSDLTSYSSCAEACAGYEEPPA